MVLLLLLWDSWFIYLGEKCRGQEKSPADDIKWIGVGILGSWVLSLSGRGV